MSSLYPYAKRGWARVGLASMRTSLGLETHPPKSALFSHELTLDMRKLMLGTRETSDPHGSRWTHTG
ncbi:conserved hypothetical protein [Ricinus communis]|uniref:Uncharacterized protein n=1 Tax=Ricinus communis TaxID=3988 RepID=B9SR70_RICCO|nr:conserved hypothetical protein [Ricinus communis]